MKWNNKNIKPEYNRDILIKVESPCDMGYAYVSGFLNEDNDCYCETYNPGNVPFDLIKEWAYIEEDVPTFEDGIWCAIQEMVLLNADWVNCGEVAKNYFVSQQCLNLQAKSGHEDEVMMDFVRQEIGIFNACEDCGKTYRVTSFNKDAPYAMCEMCYDNYLCNK